MWRAFWVVFAAGCGGGDTEWGAGSGVTLDLTDPVDRGVTGSFTFPGVAVGSPAEEGSYARWFEEGTGLVGEVSTPIGPLDGATVDLACEVDGLYVLLVAEDGETRLNVGLKNGGLGPAHGIYVDPTAALEIGPSGSLSGRVEWSSSDGCDGDLVDAPVVGSSQAVLAWDFDPDPRQ